MALLGLLDFAAFTLFLFVLAAEPHQAQASSRGFSGTKNVAVKPSVNGVCASFVIVNGYKCQELQVTTKDGYILSLQRIPEGRAEVSGNGTKKEPVIIQHGIFTAYWNWSWDEMVTNDLPAIFDYVSNQTGQKINYVGHSMGTVVALASFSEGKLVNQLKSTALLSPIAYLSHMTTELVVVAAKAHLGETIDKIGIAEFDPKGIPVADFFKDVCAHPKVDCRDLFTSLSAVRSGVLTKFNYEKPHHNMKHYGEVSPPIYNLSNIPNNLPLFMSYGGQDALSDVIDVRNLLHQLKFHDTDKLQVQFIKEYAHLDYVMAFNAKDLVYNAVTAFFKRQF